MSALLAGVGDGLLRRWTSQFDPALRFGLAGLVGLGAFGILLLPIGLISTSFGFIVGSAALLAMIGIWLWRQLLEAARFSPPRQGFPFMALAIASIACCGTLVVALGPSDSLDWDSLAYHLAVPKIWILNGKISYIGFIHHSNFPFVVDNLYIFGLHAGGEAGAKAFTIAYFVYGLVAIFGFVRSRFGVDAGWWSVMALIGVPTMLWETGTAYIDAAHGMLAGLGILLIAQWLERLEDHKLLYIGAIMLGLGAASKYTGLQIILGVGLVIATTLLIRRANAWWKPAMLAGLMAVAIPAPWLAKNAIWTGNPVFPFFYERFGGRNWDQFAADIYRDEQQTFGVGRTETGRDPMQIGAAILGLAYQPGRYVNPNQVAGGGFPIGALGVVAVAAGVAIPLSGRARGLVGYVLAATLLCLAMWFLLSQQSRYLTSLAVPLCAVAGASVSLIRAGPIMAILILGQAAYSLWLVYELSIRQKSKVVFGMMSKAEYYAQVGPKLGELATDLDRLAGAGKIALYDDVFGFFFNKPYIWANPGHSTIIDYDRCRNGADLISQLKEIGVSLVVFNVAHGSRESTLRWLEAAGLIEGGLPYSEQEWQAALQDRRTKWRALLADAIRSGRLRLELRSGSIFAFRLNPGRE